MYFLAVGWGTMVVAVAYLISLRKDSVLGWAYHTQEQMGMFAFTVIFIEVNFPSPKVNYNMIKHDHPLVSILMS